MQNKRLKTNSRNRADRQGTEHVNLGISESPRSAIADHENISPHRERSVLAQRQRTTSNGERLNASRPSSLSGRPLKITDKEGELEISLLRL